MTDSLARLNDLFPAEDLLTSPADLQHYGQDWSRFLAPNPTAVVFPREKAQVEALVRVANESGLKLVARWPNRVVGWRHRLRWRGGC